MLSSQEIMSPPVIDRVTVTFSRSSERRLKSLGKILGKLIKETTIVRLASTNESESTEGKSKTSINGNIIFWVLVNNLGPGVLFSST